MPKLGFISGSRIAPMMTGGRGKAKWGKTSDNLALTIACERLGIITDAFGDYTNEYMEWGNEQEANSIDAYQRKTFREIHGSQEWQQHPDHKYVGCTPDGLIGDDGLFETKSPKTENHIRNVLYNEQVDQYMYQMQGSLWVTGRKWCDFVSYDPRVSDGWQLHIVRVERDDKMIKEINDRYLSFEDKVSEHIQNINDRS